MINHHPALSESPAGAFSIWDAAHMFKYATSRFAAIHLAQMAEQNPSVAYKYSFVQHLVWEAEVLQRFVIPFVSMCAAKNINTSMPTYLGKVLLLVTAYQTEGRDRIDLFADFWDCQHDDVGDLAFGHRVVPCYRHNWWNNSFYYSPMQMPLWFSVAEVKNLTADHFKQRPALGLMIPEPIIHPHSEDPLLQQLQVLRTEVAHLGLDLGHLLVNKLEATEAAVDAMNQLEQPVDEVCDAMAASRVVVAVLEKDYNNGRIGTSPRGDPFPELHPFVR
ncbi:uncharacterized protein F5147DRAFT_650992 [Suillus discolor]|uniref:Uncharacterized protein n=1 Tax=Suillus discolor TaxID=1912936 RepID=A0A9P7FAJ4_9AGAM|nr:uncharacterized protein F5147DRAFT_650992 [Suillus discolor]KAG2112358.1 hypothetical protein F5147DRAFT_650992 [Suillus discolor]